MQSTVISLIIFKCSWTVTYACLYSGRTCESLNILLLLFVAEKQIATMPFFFFKTYTLVSEAQENINQQVGKDASHCLRETEKNVAGEVCV